MWAAAVRAAADDAVGGVASSPPWVGRRDTPPVCFRGLADWFCCFFFLFCSWHPDLLRSPLAGLVVGEVVATCPVRSPARARGCQPGGRCGLVERGGRRPRARRGAPHGAVRRWRTRLARWSAHVMRVFADDGWWVDTPTRQLPLLPQRDSQCVSCWRLLIWRSTFFFLKS